jgi:hypothetical protein
VYWKKPELTDENTYAPIPEPDPEDMTGMKDVVRSTWVEGLRNSIGLGISDNINRYTAYDDANKRIKGITGEELFNPGISLGEDWMSDEDRARARADFDTYRNDGGELGYMPFIRDRWAEQEWRARAEKLAEKFPDQRDAFLPKATFEEQGKGLALESSAEAADVWQRSRQGIPEWFAYGAGAMGTQIVDPAFYMSIPFGFGAGLGAKGLLIAGAKAAGINIGTQALMEPSIAAYQNRIGNNYGLPEMAKSLAIAGAFGAGVDIAGRGLWRAGRRNFGFDPVVRDGIVVGYRPGGAGRAPEAGGLDLGSAEPPPAPPIDPELLQRAGNPETAEAAQIEILKALGIKEGAIPASVATRAMNGDTAALQKVLEREAAVDPVLRRTVETAIADEALAIKPKDTIADADHAAAITQGLRHAADPDFEPMPRRIDTDAIAEGNYKKLQQEIARLRESGDTPEIAARVADLEAQMRAIDTFGRNPVADAQKLRDDPAFLTADMDLSAPGVRTARNLSKLTDEALDVVRRGEASPEIGAMVSEFVDPEMQVRAIGDLVRRRPVGPDEARAMLAELLRSPDYVKVPDAVPGPVSQAANSPRLIDDPYGAEAKAQVQALQAKMREELAAAGQDVAPQQVIDAVATPEGRAASMARAQVIEAAIAELTPAAPRGTTIRSFDTLDDLPPTLRAQVRAGNAVKFQTALRKYQAATSERERLQARMALEAAKRGEGIEGISDGDTIWIAAAAENPRATIAHEVVHALRRVGLIAPEEVALLAKAARDTGVFDKARETLYRDAYGPQSNIDEIIDEEAAAHFVDSVVKNEVPADALPQIEARGIVDRIREFFFGVREKLTQQGYRGPADDTPRDPSRDVVDAILTGEIAKREARAEWMRGNPGETKLARQVQGLHGDGDTAPMLARQEATPDEARAALFAFVEELDSRPPEPGRPFVVYRVGSAGETLDNRNAGGLMAVADILQRNDDFEAAFATEANTITAYEVTVDEPVGPYVGYTGGKPQDGTASTTVGYTNARGSAALSFPAGGKWKARTLGSVAVEDARAALERFQEYPIRNFDEAGSGLGSEAIAKALIDAGIIDPSRLTRLPGHPALFDFEVAQSGFKAAAAKRSAEGVELPGGVKVHGIPLFSMRDDGPRGIRAFHGSPHSFDKFSLDHIGSGEGAQAYGHGLYFAENDDVARQYLKKLADADATPGWFRNDAGDVDMTDVPSGLGWLRQDRRENLSNAQLVQAAEQELARAQSVINTQLRDVQTRKAQDVLDYVKSNPSFRFDWNPATGRMYEVNIKADPDQFLDWDKPLSQQSEKAKAALQPTIDRTMESIKLARYDTVPTGEPAFIKKFREGVETGNILARDLYFRDKPEVATAKLREAGIPGIKYLDGVSRGKGQGTKNYVIFDDNLIEIVAIDGQPVGPRFKFGDDPVDRTFMAKQKAGAGVYLSARADHAGHGLTAGGESVLIDADPNRTMAWDRWRQPDEARRAIDAVRAEQGMRSGPFQAGKDFYRSLSRKLGSDEAATQVLAEAGLQGHTYSSNGYRNTVLYDPALARPDPRAIEVVSRETPAEPSMVEQMRSYLAANDTGPVFERDPDGAITYVMQGGERYAISRDDQGRVAGLLPTEVDEGFAREIMQRVTKGMKPGEMSVVARIMENAGLEGPELSPQQMFEDAQLDAAYFGMDPPSRAIPDDDPIMQPRDTDTSAERKVIRDQLIEQRFAGKAPAQGQKVAIVMGGGGASGKGTVLKELRKQGLITGEYVELDPDSFKTGDKTEGWEGIPEYWPIVDRGDSRAANVTHEESSLLFKAAMRRGMEGGYNMILDRTLGTPTKAIAELQMLRDAGYEIRLIGVTVDPATAIKRAVERAKGLEKRYVPLNPLLEAHKGFSQGFEAYVKYADSVVLYDTNGPKPTPIARGRGSNLDVLDEKAYTNFARKAQLNEKADTLRQIQSGNWPDMERVLGRPDDLTGVVGRGPEGARSATEGSQPGRAQDSADLADEGLTPAQQGYMGPLYAMRDERGRVKPGAKQRVRDLQQDFAEIAADFSKQPDGKAPLLPDFEALQRKRATLLNGTAVEAGIDDMMKYKSPRGQNDIAVGFLRMHESLGVHQAPFMDLKIQRDTITKESLGRMGSVMWELRKGAISGDLRRVKNKAVRTRMENMMREAAGEKTGDAVAAQMAKAWLDVAEYLRQRFNAAGGAIGKLSGWYAPQFHDAERLLRAGREAWVGHLIRDGVLDRARMLDRQGKPLTEQALRDLLRDIWETITTDGANKAEIGDHFGKGALYKRHAEHRVLHFKNADSYLAYTKEFGGADPYSMMLGHISMMSRDIASMERFGANPEVVRERLKNHIMQDARMSRTARSLYDDLSDLVSDLKKQMGSIATPADAAIAKIGKIHARLDEIRGKPRYNAEREKLYTDLFKANEELSAALMPGSANPATAPLVQEIIALTEEMDDIARAYSVMSRNPIERAQRLIGRADEIWKLYAGQTNVPVDGNIAGATSGLRNWISSSMLVFAPMSAVTDQATGLAARAFIGMPVTRQLGSFVKAFTKQDRQFALRAQVGLDQAMNAFAVSQRFMGIANTAHVTGYIADRTHALSGLAPMTQAAKIGFASDFMSWMADLAKTKRWSSLDLWVRQMMDRHGFTEADFAALKTVTPDTYRGVPMMTKPAIEKAVGTDVAERYMRMLLREQAMAVLEPTLQGRTAFISESKPGTVMGEMSRSMAMLKSFPTSYMMLILGRFHNQWLAGRAFSTNTIAAGAAILVGGVLLGALAMQMKALGKGQDPLPMDDHKFWVRAFLQSGGLGIFGDFVANNINRQGGSLAQTLAGPLASEAQLLTNLTLGNLLEYGQGEPTNAGRELTNYLRQRTPGAFVPWYIRTAYNRMVLDQLQEMLDPDAHKAMRRQIKNQKKLGGNEFYWRPGESSPERGPNLGAAFGQQ